MNEKIRLEDDFYESVNGEWLEKAQIPADKSSISSFYEIHNQSEKGLDERNCRFNSRKKHK
nr:hypothetical protein [Mycoplasmopsis bovis]